MLDEVIFALVAIVVLIAVSVIRPTSAACPRGHYVEGVRPSGETRCLPVPAPSRGCAGSRACPDGPPYRTQLPLQIYCTGGAIPIVVDERTVGCTRRFGT